MCLCNLRPVFPHTAQKLFYPKMRKNSSALLQLERDDIKDFRMKVSINHINMECKDTDGNTPFSLAVMNGKTTASFTECDSGMYMLLKTGCEYWLSG